MRPGTGPSRATLQPEGAGQTRVWSCYQFGSLSPLNHFQYWKQKLPVACVIQGAIFHIEGGRRQFRAKLLWSPHMHDIPEGGAGRRQLRSCLRTALEVPAWGPPGSASRTLHKRPDRWMLMTRIPLCHSRRTHTETGPVQHQRKWHRQHHAGGGTANNGSD